MKYFATRLAFLVALLLAVGQSQAEGLKSLNDSQLSRVTGREGVAMDFVYAMNAYHEDSASYTAPSDPTNPYNPLDPNRISDSNHKEGDPLSSLGNCDGLMNPCSLGITVNNRPGMWVMLKDMYGIQKINNFWIDGRETQDVARVPAVADMNRFVEGEGASATCVLPGRTTSNCFADSPSLPSLAMQYGPASGDGFDTFEADVEWHLYIGRVAVQYDDQDPSLGPAYLPANDQPGSFMSYQITDMHQKAAKFDYDGRVVMFGW